MSSGVLVGSSEQLGLSHAIDTDFDSPAAKEVMGMDSANFGLKSSDAERSGSSDLLRTNVAEETATDGEAGGDEEPNTEGETTEEASPGEEFTEDETEVTGAKDGDMEETDMELTSRQTDGPTDGEAQTDATDAAEPTDGEATDMEFQTDGESGMRALKTTEDEDEDLDEEGDSADEGSSDEEADEDAEGSAAGDARAENQVVSLPMAVAVGTGAASVSTPTVLTTAAAYRSIESFTPHGSIGGGVSPLRTGLSSYSTTSYQAGVISSYASPTAAVSSYGIPSVTNASSGNATAAVASYSSPSAAIASYGSPAGAIASYNSPTAAVSSYGSASGVVALHSSPTAAGASYSGPTASGGTYSSPIAAGTTYSSQGAAVTSYSTTVAAPPSTPAASGVAPYSYLAGSAATSALSGPTTGIGSYRGSSAVGVASAGAAVPVGTTAASPSGMPASSAAAMPAVVRTPVPSTVFSDTSRIEQVQGYSGQGYSSQGYSSQAALGQPASQMTLDSHVVTNSQSLPMTTGSLGAIPTSGSMSQQGLTMTASTLGSTLSGYPRTIQLSSSNLVQQRSASNLVQEKGTLGYGRHTTPAAVGSRYTPMTSPMSVAPRATPTVTSGTMAELGHRKLTGDSRPVGLHNAKVQTGVSDTNYTAGAIPAFSSQATTSCTQLPTTKPTAGPGPSIGQAQTVPFPWMRAPPLPVTNAQNTLQVGMSGMPSVSAMNTATTFSGVAPAGTKDPVAVLTSMSGQTPAPLVVSQFVQGSSHTTPARGWEDSAMASALPFGSQTTPHIQAPRGISSFSRPDGSVISGPLLSVAPPVQIQGDRLGSHNASYLAYPRQVHGISSTSPAAPFLVEAAQHPAAPFMTFQPGPVMATSVSDASLLGREQPYDIPAKVGSRAGSESKRCRKGQKHHPHSNLKPGQKKCQCGC